MKFLNVTVAIFIYLYSSSNYAAFILEGEYEIYNFSSSDFSESMTVDDNRVQIQLTFANSFDVGGLEDPHFYNGHLELGETMRVDFYENQGDILPFATHVLDGQTPESYAHIFGWHNFLGAGDAFQPWLDLEGSIVITSITGEIEMLQPSLIIIEDGIEYSGNASISSVPLPATTWLFGSGLIGLVGLARRKKALS